MALPIGVDLEAQDGANARAHRWTDALNNELIRVVAELNPYTAGHGQKKQTWEMVAAELHQRKNILFAGKSCQDQMKKLLEAHQTRAKGEVKESSVQEKVEEGKSTNKYLDELLAVRSLCLAAQHRPYGV